MRFAGLVAVTAALALATPAAGAAKHVVETAVGGGVEADFSYDFSAPYRFTHPHLTIKRSEVVLLDLALKPLQTYAQVVPARYFEHAKSVSIQDLDADREPEVVLDLYWGGAHCCWYTNVYRYDPSGNRYLLTRHFWGDAGYRASDLDRDGRREFVSGDSRFAYVFTDFADSSWPLQIWSYRGGRFVDVTRTFPHQIRGNARRQWRWALSKQRRANNVGFLAAWAADQCLLGHERSAFRQLDALGRQHRLGLGWDKTAKRFVRHLQTFLRRTGYLAK